LRAWREGDDPRRLDWAASARAGEPIARVVRGESAPERLVVIDASLSMAVGSPCKLQLAAELAAFWCAQALQAGGRVHVACRSAMEREGRWQGSQAVPRVLSWLESIEADGQVAPTDLAAQLAAPGEACVLGDWTTIQPALLCPRRPRGGLRAVLVLAREELDPSLASAVAWCDPETGERRSTRVDAGSKFEYQRGLWRELERRAASFAQARSRFVACGADEPFERVAPRLEDA
jgi:uncharacterized protein (DUF58 family)